MNAPEPQHSSRTTDPKLDSFRRAILRGLAVLLPPLLTIVIFIWVWNTLREYVLIPVETSVTNVMIWTTYEKEIKEQNPDPEGGSYVQLEDDRWVPREVYDVVRHNPGGPVIPNTADGVYRRYIQVELLPWWFVGPVFILTLLIVLSMVGRLLAAGVGRMIWNAFDRLLHNVPIIRNVYGSVKQVTDFLFSEREIQFTRVVAVEYPRKGVWSLGFVTSESMLDIHSAANEPMVSLLIPTSPIPGTGFTINAKKSETVDLNLTVDQALQFIVSCGVVVPPQQLTTLAEKPTEDAAAATPENGRPEQPSATSGDPAGTAAGDEEA